MGSGDSRRRRTASDHAPRRPPRGEYKSRDPAVTSRMMAAVKNKNSLAEVALRQELWRRGYRYRLHRKGLVGRPDVVFVSARVVVFVDSDFWHARVLVEDGEQELRATIRGARQDWWVAKLTRNVGRDREVTSALRASGWTVVRIWESEVFADAEEAADRVERAILMSDAVQRR